MRAVDEEGIILEALRAAHRLDLSNSMRALGVLVARFVAVRFGATMATDCVLRYDEILHIEADIRRIVEWCFDHPEAASDLLTILEASERAHPESVEMRVRSLCSAIRHDPETVTKVAEELKRRRGVT